MIAQLSAIFDLPLGRLLIAAVVCLALLALKLFELARDLRRERDYAQRLNRRRFEIMRGGKA